MSMDNLTRRKRVSENGEWEFECVRCKNWYFKSKFTGCVDKIDAYGNCLKCRSCIGKDAMAVRNGNVRNQVEEILIGMGFDPYNTEKPVWKQAEERYKIKYGYNNNNGNL